MVPDVSHKKLPNGQVDANKMWMAEMELPLQAQALEVLTADARRMMFPDSGPWFRAHAQVTDDYLSRRSISVADPRRRERRPFARSPRTTPTSWSRASS
jgi:hypothetical protein